MRCQGNSHKPVKSRIERFLTVTVAYNSIKRAQSPNLPNHQGMSAGIPAQLGTHPARKNQVLPKCPQKE